MIMCRSGQRRVSYARPNNRVWVFYCGGLNEVVDADRVGWG